jgi:hypothetical protein
MRAAKAMIHIALTSALFPLSVIKSSLVWKNFESIAALRQTNDLHDPQNGSKPAQLFTLRSKQRRES